MISKGFTHCWVFSDIFKLICYASEQVADLRRVNMKLLAVSTCQNKKADPPKEKRFSAKQLRVNVV